MQRSTLTGQRLVAVFLIGFVLFNYPVLSLFDRTATLFGLPLVFAYLFLVWAGLILLMAWVVERRGDRAERLDRAGG
ncbi:MAG: hypothetical protein IPL58_01365 [Betaproteobacteria bacterium]|jgi:hypothetical protein|uniref:DUF3311 domain-containing protein n=1 Tax=Candidatus Proximibacter danicus TaxID=2954365 RepID=A0A9D7PRF2_9PROT|nr:hypothetical protein [Candidatus Proximibacter danicus]MBK9445534.1 hypothetical protein [Betaproteobacteria bacterium]